ncbi:hypothetical protein NE237_019209 [Protea cynaroides]|uniref:Uncharacterized protein n=1 Tax=Protea cynaroides TaxID=273540 RepID=A0A9Q0QPN1_9MAGN|nr:hypothetical protein NE237_019209 [Protea cynaroides]
MGRSPCCSKVGLNRGVWTVLEDKILSNYISIHGEGRWRDLPKNAGLKRCGKSCRLRWLNYLRPDIKRGNITHDEEELIIRLHKLLGNRWSLIAGRLPGRTDNEIKNYWNTTLSKKVQGNQSKTKTKILSADEPELPLMESRVFRTKASRCNRVFLIPEPDSNQEVAEHGKTKLLELKHEGDDDEVAVESDSQHDGLLSFNPVKEEDSSDLMIDLDRYCLSDLLMDSDLFEFDNGEAGEGSCDGNSNESLLSWDEPVLLRTEAEEEMVGDWTVNQCIEPDLDFTSFTSILGHAETWLSDCN